MCVHVDSNGVKHCSDPTGLSKLVFSIRWEDVASPREVVSLVLHFQKKGNVQHNQLEYDG